VEIVGYCGPPWQYRVEWTGWEQTSWVDAADVTPLAINAYWQQQQQPPPPPPPGLKFLHRQFSASTPPTHF